MKTGIFKRPAKRLIGGSLVLCVLISLGFAFPLWSEENTSSDEVRYTVTIGSIERSVSAVGTLEPADYLDVGVQVSGQVERLHVEVGDDVQEGDLLAEIDATVFEASVDAERAALRRLEASMEEKRAQIDLARSRFERQGYLLSERATSQADYDAAAAEVQILEAQAKGLQAQIDQTASSLRANEANLGFTRIYAPMGGTVVSLDARVGQTLNANQTTPIILRLADLSTMTVRAQVSEADIMRLQTGMSAYFSTLGSRERRWEGDLRQILPTPEVVSDVVLYHALFDVDNADRNLLSNMTAQVFFVEARVMEVPVIPAAVLASVSQAARSMDVILLNGDGTTSRKVALGARDRVSVEVVEGLSPGDVFSVSTDRMAPQTQPRRRTTPRL